MTFIGRRTPKRREKGITAPEASRDGTGELCTLFDAAAASTVMSAGDIEGGYRGIK